MTEHRLEELENKFREFCTATTRNHDSCKLHMFYVLASATARRGRAGGGGIRQGQKAPHTPNLSVLLHASREP